MTYQWLHAIWHSLYMAFMMAWDILWALILGFSLSALVQAFVPKGGMNKLLPDAKLKSLLVACGLGIASSSCSYAAVALTRSIIRKGADFVAAMAFQMASTNLVIELGILITLLLGWQFTLAEFLGGFILVIVMAVLFRLFVAAKSIREAKKQADRGVAGKMEAHATMDMSSNKNRLTAVSHYFVMDWVAIWKDIVIGLLIAGALAVIIPENFWTGFFLESYPNIAKIWGPLIGPFVAIFSFVCSVGNVPLAVVLWKGGISFGGVIAFIFADLIVIPILDIYRKYYGLTMAAIIFIIYYISMVIAALIIEFSFEYLNLIPTNRKAAVFATGIQLNYTTVLNIIFMTIAVFLIVRFFRTGGKHMLKMM